MKNRQIKYDKYMEYWIIGFIFLLLFLLPVLFTRVDGRISWLHVTKIWKDQMLLIPLFIANRWLFVPKMLFRKNYIAYVLCVLGLITIFTTSYYYHDEVLNKRPLKESDIENKRPEPIPPFANLLMYSLLIVGVDTGLLFSKRAHEIEKKKHLLEKENAKMELDILRNQISPHFFMNTLNNIYALIDCNTPVAKESVMKLSKLMRYMLYENESGKVYLSKEFEFIRSYIDLMKLRFADGITIRFITPESFTDVMIPPMLFIAFVENAFKYGASYDKDSLISIVFAISENTLSFKCYNTIHPHLGDIEKGGLGIRNSENRLKLLFGKNYTLELSSAENIYNVDLKIPLSR